MRDTSIAGNVTLFSGSAGKSINPTGEPNDLPDRQDHAHALCALANCITDFFKRCIC